MKDPQMPNQLPDHTDAGKKKGGQARGGRSDKDLGLIDSKSLTKGDCSNPKTSDGVGRPLPVEPKTLDERRRGDSFRWK